MLVSVRLSILHFFTAGPSMFALSFITLITKTQETLSLFDSSGAGESSATAVTICNAPLFFSFVYYTPYALFRQRTTIFF